MEILCSRMKVRELEIVAVRMLVAVQIAEHASPLLEAGTWGFLSVIPFTREPLLGGNLS